MHLLVAIVNWVIMAWKALCKRRHCQQATIAHKLELMVGDMLQAADVYAFGILLWEMCTGQKPWVGLKEQEIITKVVQNEKQPLFPRDTPAPFKVSSCCLFTFS